MMNVDYVRDSYGLRRPTSFLRLNNSKKMVHKDIVRPMINNTGYRVYSNAHIYIHNPKEINVYKSSQHTKQKTKLTIGSRTCTAYL